MCIQQWCQPCPYGKTKLSNRLLCKSVFALNKLVSNQKYWRSCLLDAYSYINFKFLSICSWVYFIVTISHNNTYYLHVFKTICSDQSNSSNTAENKKKKERRKDKDNASMETSDDEVTEVQGKNLIHSIFIYLLFLTNQQTTCLSQ